MKGEGITAAVASAGARTLFVLQGPEGTTVDDVLILSKISVAYSKSGAHGSASGKVTLSDLKMEGGVVVEVRGTGECWRLDTERSDPNARDGEGGTVSQCGGRTRAEGIHEEVNEMTCLTWS